MIHLYVAGSFVGQDQDDCDGDNNRDDFGGEIGLGGGLPAGVSVGVGGTGVVSVRGVIDTIASWF